MICSTVHREGVFLPWKIKSVRNMMMLTKMRAFFSFLIAREIYGLSTRAVRSIGSLDAQLKQMDARDRQSLDVLFEPVKGEILEAMDVELVHGEIPKDLALGALLRIGPNEEAADGSGAFFDGDGMTHSIKVDRMASKYTRSYVQTVGRGLEAKHPESKKYRGTLEVAPRGRPILWSLLQNFIDFGAPAQKDTANTAVVVHGDSVLAAMEQGMPSRLQVRKNSLVQTIKSGDSLNGVALSDPISGCIFPAHGRIDPETNEFFCVSYSSANPGCEARIDAFGPEGLDDHLTSMPIALPKPAMMHDSCITSNYVCLLDSSLKVDAVEMLLRDNFPVVVENTKKARIGLVERKQLLDPSLSNREKKIIWFDVEPYVALHALNAFERPDGTVVLRAFKSEPRLSYMAEYTLSALYEWILDPSTGTLISEAYLNTDTAVEFPVVDPRRVGQDHNRAFGVRVKNYGGPLRHFKAPAQGILLDAVVAFGFDQDESENDNYGNVVDSYELPSHVYYVSEPTFVPKVGSAPDSEEGYILSIATDTNDLNNLQSQVHVLDAQNLNGGPIALLRLPVHIPYGIHSAFVPERLLVD